MIGSKHDYRTEELLLRVQSKKASFVETLTNTSVGYCVQVTLCYVLFLHYGDPKAHIFAFSMWMTLASVIRGYILRRLFNTEFWKRWRRERVVTESNERARTVRQIAGDLDGLSRDQKRRFNPRLLDLLDKEISRVLYSQR